MLRKSQSEGNFLKCRSSPAVSEETNGKKGRGGVEREKRNRLVLKPLFLLPPVFGLLGFLFFSFPLELV